MMLFIGGLLAVTLSRSFFHRHSYPMPPVLPSIPAKRYFTIGEVGDLCDVKPHVLRYWEQEFTQLRPMKRRGNRRYYQHHEVLMIRRIRELLYDQGFTISGARNKLPDFVHDEGGQPVQGDELVDVQGLTEKDGNAHLDLRPLDGEAENHADISRQLMLVRRELLEIRELLASTS